MDNNRNIESPDHAITSLGGLYTDFDGWVAKFNSHYKRSTYFSKEISNTTQAQNDTRQNRDDIFEKDFFFNDILLRQRHIRHSAKPPSFNFYKENDGFVFYDHVFYRIMNRNGDNRIVCQYIRSKL